MEEKELLTLESLHDIIEEYFKGFADKIEYQIQKQYLSIRVYRKDYLAGYLFDIYELNDIAYDKLYHTLENIKGIFVRHEQTIILEKAAK